MTNDAINLSKAVEWPPIDNEVINAVVEQLMTSTSIYDGGGIFAEFEAAFANIHGVRHALTVSSGTAALHSAYFALGLGPGDEVIVPDYTFFATATPLFQLGVLPVVVDCTSDGRADLQNIEAQITDRTRAVVITHMWGRPENVAAIRAFCDTHNLFMIEDCSHAHGARFEGVAVGSLADVAAWSLQASKLIPAGEGGVFATNSQQVLERALLLGHFNRRCLRAIPQKSPNWSWAETGVGLKYRAHPLGIAMANVILKRLPSVLSARQSNANQLAAALLGTPVSNLRSSGRLASTIDAYYSFVMVVNSEKTAMTPKDIVTELERLGFEHADVPRAIRPLHEFPLFQTPVSPVVSYDRRSLRCEYPNASKLAKCTLKIPVPSIDGAVADAYCDRFQIALQGVTP